MKKLVLILTMIIFLMPSSVWAEKFGRVIRQLKEEGVIRNITDNYLIK